MRRALFLLALGAAVSCRDWDALDPRLGSGGATTAVTSSSVTSSSTGGSGTGGSTASTGGGGAVVGPTYVEVIVGDMPLAYYRLGDMAGVLLDSGPNGLDGVYEDFGFPTESMPDQQGKPGAIAGDPDTAVSFDTECIYESGPGHKVNFYVPNTGSFDLHEQDFSLEAWLKVECANNSGGFRQILSVGDLMVDTGWQLSVRMIGSAPTPVLRWGNGTALQVFDCPSGIPVDGQFHHLVVTFDYVDPTTSTVSCYVDKVANSGQRGAPPSPSTSVPELQVGTNGVSNYPFPGVLDEIAIYTDVVLTQQQVEEHHDVGRGR